MHMSRLANYLIIGFALFSQASLAQQQTLPEAKREELRRKAEELRERNRREREELQKNFRSPDEPASSPAVTLAPQPQPRPSAQFNPAKPCDGNIESRLERYRRWKPELNQQLTKTIETGQLYIGMPLEMFKVITCESVKDYNVTITGTGESIQYIMDPIGIVSAKYVYFRNGRLIAIQN